MATDTETYSLASTTVPTDYTSPTPCPPAPTMHKPSDGRQDFVMNEASCAHWDAKIQPSCSRFGSGSSHSVPHFMMHPTIGPQPSDFNDDMSDSGSSNYSRYVAMHALSDSPPK